MGTRLEFQSVLEALLGSGNVYFQPPPSFVMEYPAIVYNRWNQSTDYADNAAYRQVTRYRVTVIDVDPDSLIPNKVGALEMSSYFRHLVKNNLNHDIYDVYF
jgi:hypothetical protein